MKIMDIKIIIQEPRALYNFLYMKTTDSIMNKKIMESLRNQSFYRDGGEK